MKKTLKKIALVLTPFLLTLGVFLLVRGKIWEKEPKVLKNSEGVEEIISTPLEEPENSSETKVVSGNRYVGFGKISDSGVTTSFEMIIQGVQVSGTLSGFCKGTLKGTFDPNTSFIHGDMKGSCSLVPASGSFKGEIGLENKTGLGTYEGKSSVLSKSGVWEMAIK